MSLSTKLAEREKTTTELALQPFAFNVSFEEKQAQRALDFRHEPSASTQWSPTNVFYHEPSVSTERLPTSAFIHEPFGSTDGSSTNAFTHESSVPTRSSPTPAPTPEHRNLSTESLLDCLLSGGTLYLHAFGGSLTIDTNHLEPRNVSYDYTRCTVIVTIPDGHIMTLKPVRLQGLCVCVFLYVVSEKIRYDSVNSKRAYLGCPEHFSVGWTPGREHIYVPPYARLRIVFEHDRSSLPPSPVPPFIVEMHFSSLPGSTDLLNVDFTTPLNGKL